MPTRRNLIERQKPGAPTRAERRHLLRIAFTEAVSGEHRFGSLTHVRPELDQRWEKVMSLMDELWLTK